MLRISKERLTKLLEDSFKLMLLNQLGVENWSGYYEYSDIHDAEIIGGDHYALQNEFIRKELTKIEKEIEE